MHVVGELRQLLESAVRPQLLRKSESVSWCALLIDDSCLEHDKCMPHSLLQHFAPLRLFRSMRAEVQVPDEDVPGQPESLSSVRVSAHCQPVPKSRNRMQASERRVAGISLAPYVEAS